MIEFLKVVADSWPLAWMFIATLGALVIRRAIVRAERSDRAEQHAKAAAAARPLLPTTGRGASRPISDD